MTLIEAAASLGITPDTLRQRIRAGTLKATKRGRDWWVTAAEVERYRRENLGKRGHRACVSARLAHSTGETWSCLWQILLTM